MSENELNQSPLRSANRGMQRALCVSSVLYLIVLLVIWGCVLFDSGAWWPVTLFLFSPRWAVALPLVVLIPLTLVWRRKWTLIYFLHAWIILFPIMGLGVAWDSRKDAALGPSLRIMTCNLGEGADRIDRIIALVKAHRIQVLTLQECLPTISQTVFSELGWPYEQAGNIALGSSLKLERVHVIARQPPSHYNAVAAIACDFRLSEGPAPIDGDASPDQERVHLICLHLPTFRPGFEKARKFDVRAGDEIEQLGSGFREVVEQIQHDIDAQTDALLIAGDFNVPVESVFYRDYWSDYQNALSIAGSGLRYTKYTRLHGIRIDHVLADDNWSVRSAMVGPDLGGDHRPVIVELNLVR
jgi:vancomycin resistance protein VanJ